MDSSNAFNLANFHNERIVVRNGEIIFIKNFFNEEQSDYYFKILMASIHWKQETIKMYGKTLPFPRLTAWYGDKSYTFSGITLQPYPWTSDLFEIKRKVESMVDVAFNSVLLNRYRDGNDSISWHADNEKELGNNPVIASVNFGAMRPLQLRHIETKEKITLELSHGSLLIMRGALQHFWKHQIPKTKKAVGERINLTFRVIQ